MRTFFYCAELQESKSEVLSISAMSDWAVQELVIAGVQLVTVNVSILNLKNVNLFLILIFTLTLNVGGG